MSYNQYIGKQVRMGILDEKNLTDESAVEYKNVNVTKVDDNTMTYLDNEVEHTVPINLINKIEIINGRGGGRRRRTKHAAKSKRSSRRRRSTKRVRKTRR